VTSIGVSAEKSELPSPGDLPNAAVLIYDGDCKFCLRSVAKIHRWDGADRIAFLPLQDPLVAKAYPDLSQEELMEQMYLVDQQGTRHGGAAAFRYLSRRLPRLWALAPLMHIPFSLPLWQFFYRQVAMRRYWFGGKRCDDGTCRI